VGGLPASLGAIRSPFAPNAKPGETWNGHLMATTSANGASLGDQVLRVGKMTTEHRFKRGAQHPTSLAVIRERRT
jgi:hypothetical protein